jgi:dUTP pyrophosphatase
MKKNNVSVKIINRSGNKLPAYESGQSAGMDLRAFTEEPIIIQPRQRAVIGTGIYIQLPEEFEAQVRPRSGLAAKNGITVLNSPGTVDADYRGEIKVILINHSDEPFHISNGDRIAQMVIAKYERIEWSEADELQSSDRGTGGFGSTGK